MMIAGYKHELGLFQLDIARRWFQRGEDTASVEAKFFFYYTAFNAIFFYWKMVDCGVKKRVSEHEQIENLVRRFGSGSWDRLQNEALSEMKFFVQREPIQKMDDRSDDDPREGDPTLGEKHRSVLQEASADALDKLIALAKILYIVRCNLCHGSKGALGDDMVVIERGTRLLRVLADESIRYTGAKLLGH